MCHGSGGALTIGMVPPPLERGRASVPSSASKVLRRAWRCSRGPSVGLPPPPPALKGQARGVGGSSLSPPWWVSLEVLDAAGAQDATTGNQQAAAAFLVQHAVCVCSRLRCLAESWRVQHATVARNALAER